MIRPALLALGLCIAAAAPLHAVTFSAWVASYGLTGGDATATADPDADGLPNLIEFALDGLNPTVSDSGPTFNAVHTLFFQTRNSDGSWNAMTTTGPVGGATTHLVLRIKKRADAEGITYLWQTSAKDLQRWGWGSSAIFKWDADGYSYGRTISNARKWGNKGFIRLRIGLIE